MIALSILIAIVQTTRKNAWIPGDWSARAFLAAFILLAIAFAITMHEPIDLAYSLNFLMFALYPTLSAGLGRLGNKANGRVIATLSGLGCVIALSIALVQFGLDPAGRVSSFGSDPIWSAQAAMIAGFLALLGMMVSTFPWRWLFTLAPPAMVLVAFLSGSRGPLMAAPVLLAIYLILGTRRWWLSLAVTACAGAVCLLLIGTFLPATMARMMTVLQIVSDLGGNGTIAEQSASERQLMYEASIAAFLHSPWFGYGWADIVPAIAPYLPNGLASFQQIHHHLHSDSLDFAISAGIFGLIAYLLVLAAPILGVMNSPRDGLFRFRLTAAIGLVAGYAIFGLTYLTFGYEYHTTLYVCLTAIIVGFAREHAPPVVTSSAWTEGVEPAHAPTDARADISLPAAAPRQGGGAL